MTAFLPDLILLNGRIENDVSLICDESGHITRFAGPDEVGRGRVEASRFTNRVLLPGLINAHSHAFQRVIRGRTERRTRNEKDSFWTWREMMYSAATRLSPEDIYDASRMAFLEMVLSGITSVGEFHYLHCAPDGSPYDDPNLLAKEVIRAARDVGLRIALLRVSYSRSGYQTEVNPKQKRFIESDSEIYLLNLDKLIADVTRVSSPTVREGFSQHDAIPNGRATDTAWV